MFLHTKLEFQGHLKIILNKVNKTIGLLRKPHNILPRVLLLTIFKSFKRPHLDYEDIIYDQEYSVSFHQYNVLLESIQYNSGLVITGAIIGTSTERLHNKLDLDTLEKRRWYKKLSCFYIMFIKVILQNTYLTLFPLPWAHITQEILIKVLNLK